MRPDITGSGTQHRRFTPMMKGALIGVALFSALINLLSLTGSFYMLQVYDRVIPSRSLPTLVALSILALTLYAAQAALDFFRGRILLRIARAFDDRYSPRVFALVAHQPLAGRSANAGLQPVRDLDQIRGFLASGGPLGFFDLPWMPFYLAICFLFHPMIGLVATLGAVLLVVFTVAAEMMTRKPLREAAVESVSRFALAEAAQRNAEVVVAMGMSGAVGGMWNDANRRHLDAHDRASDAAGAIGGLSKAARMALQSAVLGVGGYLVIRGEATGGIIIAGSILSARALAPIELVLAHWKNFVAARQNWRRLSKLMAAFSEPVAVLPLRAPAAILQVDALAVSPPGDRRVVVKNVNFELKSGEALGVIGPSASGKSSLARALVGVWTPLRGSVRLDGATLEQWSSEARGRHIGYLPQDNLLLEGTIGQNIARFQADADPGAIIRAAEQAGVHDMILRLPAGYETRVGEAGHSLSGGQRQRVALARALYGEPFLVVLDEPNSNLDADGDEALARAIMHVRSRGGIAIVIAHRPNALASVDKVLVMSNGDVTAYGAKSQIFQRMTRPTPNERPRTAVGAA